MKRKDIKKYYKSKIVKGWRDYLDLKVPYEKLGIGNKFLSIKDIERILGLRWSGIDSGFVGEYYMYDYSRTYNNIPMTVKVETSYEYIPKNTTIEQMLERNQLPNDLLYIVDKDRLYYIEGRQGYVNPNYNYDNPDFNIDYWLYDDNEELKQCEWYLVKGDESEIEILERYVNSEKFLANMFSGNFTYSLLSGNIGQNINNDLFSDLSKLSSYTKTIYTEFKEEHVVITYAIRYDDYVDTFLTDLKKIITKHKIKKF